MIIRYDSPAELRADYIRRNARANTSTHSGRANVEWYGGETIADTLRLTEFGDTKLVPKAEALLDKLDTAIETSRRTWEPAPAGAFVCVPDVLAGHPTPMRRLIYQQDETSPITILVNTSSSAGINADTLQKRGIVILALVMALSRLRPVSLQQLAIMHGIQDGETIFTSQINTAPLDLATACYVLTSAGFARELTYCLGRSYNRFNGGWPREFDYGRPDKYYTSVQQKLGLDPTKTLVIGAAQLGDELLSDPVRWINKQIAHFTSQGDEVP